MEKNSCLNDKASNWMEVNWMVLTHWIRVTHICVSKLAIIGSDNGLLPGQHQAIIYTSAGILLIRTIGTNFSEILSEIHTLLFKKMHLKYRMRIGGHFCPVLNSLALDIQCRYMKAIQQTTKEPRWRTGSVTTYLFAPGRCNCNPDLIFKL